MFTTDCLYFCLFSSPFCLSGLSSSPSSSQTEPTMRTVPYISTMATPRPALTPSSARGQTPTRCPSVPPEKTPYAGHCSSSRPELHLRPNHKDLSQSGVDSSGYSSSEGPLKKPTAATSSTSRLHSGAPSTGYRSKISSAFFSLMGEYGVCVCLHVCVCVLLCNNLNVSYVLCRLNLIDGRRSTVKNNACDNFRYGVGVNV